MASPVPLLPPGVNLADEHALWEQVLRETPAGIAVSAGPEHRLTFFNEQFQANAGGRAQLGEPVAACLPEIVVQGFVAVLDEVYRTGQPFDSREMPIDVLNPATDRLDTRYYDFTFKASRNDQGAVQGVLAFTVDVSTQARARRAAEQEVIEQREFYETLLQEVPMGIIAFDAEHRYVFANPKFAHHADFHNWVVGKTNAEACAIRGYPPEVAIRRQQRFDQALRERGEVTWEETIVSPQGTNHWLRRMRPVFNPDGTLRLMVASGVDATERRRAEGMLRQQQAIIQRIVDAIPHPISVTDARGKASFANAAQQELRRRTAQRRQLFKQAPDQAPEFTQLAQLHREVLTSGQDVAVDLACPFDNGEVHYCQVVMRPLEQPDGAVHVLTVITDITALQQAERAALSAAQSRESFLATMSHEIRTPLNGVLGMAALLAKTALSPEQQRYLDVVQHSGRLLMAILNDVLDMAKITAGQLHLETVAVDVNQALQQTAQTLAFQAAEKGLAFVVEPLAVPPPLVLTDPYRLGQVLLNLLSNAIKFTEVGRVTLHAKALAETPGALTVHFCVRDTGLGLSPEAQEHIFDAFAQASVDTTRRFGGTGLGLAISSLLVQQLGGHLVVCSEPGQGSTFGFTIRFAKAPRAVPRVLAPAGQSDEAEVRGWRVLLVDDNALNLELAQAVLAQNGVAVDAALSGPAALALFEQHRYHAVLMDIHMPGMNGLEATARIRQHPDRSRAATPVLAMTADAFRAQHEGYRAAGMNDCVTKPFHEADLLRKLVAARAGRGEPGANS